VDIIQVEFSLRRVSEVTELNSTVCWAHYTHFRYKLVTIFPLI